MPRDLTDLMETATRVAPPEPHAAAEITRQADRSLRRRRTSLVGGLALVAVVAGVAGYGVTRHHDTTPEPATHFKHGQTVSGSDAVPASSLPGYQPEPWSLPSIQHLSNGDAPLATYRSVDADGRLIVQRYPGSRPQGRLQVQLYDRPGASPSSLQIPSSPGTNAGKPISWLPTFTGDGRLLWAPDLPIVDNDKAAFHVTDLDGSHDLVVHSGFTIGKLSFSGAPGVDPGGFGMSGGRYWFQTYDHNLPGLQGAAFTLYTASFGGSLTKVADDVAAMAADDGRVAWVTTAGEVMTETSDDPSPHQVDVPLSAGCALTPTRDLQSGLGDLAVDRAVIALTERCGTGRDADDELLAFDPGGRMLVHLTGVATSKLSLTRDAVLAEGLDVKTSDIDVLRYDLLTGRLARLGAVSRTGGPPQGAGDYVLWYDTDGGHVARIPD
jgi:hypothetical protein